MAAPQPKNLFDTLRGPGLSPNKLFIPECGFFSFSILAGVGLPLLPPGATVCALYITHAKCSSDSELLHYYKVGCGGAMDLMGHVFFS